MLIDQLDGETRQGLSGQILLGLSLKHSFFLGTGQESSGRRMDLSVKGRSNNFFIASSKTERQGKLKVSMTLFGKEVMSQESK